MVGLIVARDGGHVNHHDVEMTDIVDDRLEMVIQVLVRMEVMDAVNENAVKVRKKRNDG